MKMFPSVPLMKMLGRCWITGADLSCTPCLGYYTMCFIDGLKDHIHAPVSLHRPKNLDTMFVFLPYCRRRSLARQRSSGNGILCLQWNHMSSRLCHCSCHPTILISWLMLLRVNLRWTGITVRPLMIVGPPCVHIGVLKGCVFIVLVNGPRITNLHRLFNSMWFRNWWRFLVWRIRPWLIWILLILTPANYWRFCLLVPWLLFWGLGLWPSVGCWAVVQSVFSWIRELSYFCHWVSRCCLCSGFPASVSIACSSC